MAFVCIVRPVVKLISTILLLVLNAVPVAYLFVFQSHQRSIRHQMEERLEEEMLHTISLPRSELKWVKPGKEIVIGDNMFDIVTLEDQGNGMLLITGIYDYEESFLVMQMNKSQQEDNSKSKKLVQLAQLMQAIHGNEEEEDLLQQPVPGNWHIVDDPSISSPFRNILTPPPQG